MCTATEIGAGVVVGAGAGCAGTGFGGATRPMTTGVGLDCTRTGVGAGRRWTTGAMTITRLAGSCRWSCGTGSAGASTIAGWDALGKTVNGGVWTPAGPAKSRGNAAAPATAPASNSPATTPLVIALMVPTPDADSITRTRYRHVGTRA